MLTKRNMILHSTKSSVSGNDQYWCGMKQWEFLYIAFVEVDDYKHF